MCPNDHADGGLPAAPHIAACMADEDQVAIERYAKRALKENRYRNDHEDRPDPVCDRKLQVHAQLVNR